MMQFPPLKPPHRAGRFGSLISYRFISNYLKSSARRFLAGICLHHFFFLFPASHHFASITIAAHTVLPSNRCQLLLTKLISCSRSSASLLVITQSGELSVLLSLMGRGEDRQCEAQSQIPIVILCRRSVNELVWRVMNDHFCAPLASKLVAVYSCGLLWNSIGTQKITLRKNSPLNL